MTGKAAIYCRLSEEDRDKKHKTDESGSIQNHDVICNRRTAYAELKLSGKLDEHLAEIDQTCNERMERIVKQMAEREGVTEALKASGQMAWVGAMSAT